MADSDSFIQEVTEEVRRDKLFAAWKKFGPWVIGAIVIIVVGTAGRAWWLEREIDERRAQGGAFIAAQNAEQPESSAEAFRGIMDAAEGDYAALAGLRAGAALGEAGAVEDAIAQYEAVVAMESIDPRLKDLAQLRIVMIGAERMEPDEALERLQPLVAVGAPWRAPALEFEASALLRKGDTAGAIAALNTLLDDDKAPVSTKQRAAEMIAALGGDPAQDTDSAVSGGAETPDAGSTEEGG